MDDPTFQRLLAEIDTLDTPKGLDMNELLNISDDLRSILVWMVRQHGFQTEDLAAQLGRETESAQKLLERLAGKAMVEEVEDTQLYYVQVASSRSARKYRVSEEVWKVFD
jgi:predicted transcriptional regulator